MADIRAISAFLQVHLESEGIPEVSAVQAAQWLDAAGLLKDDSSRPGKPLREILRNSRGSEAIAGAQQESNRRWWIRRVQAPRNPENRPQPQAQTLPQPPARTTRVSSAEPIITIEDARAAGFSGFLSVGDCIEKSLPLGEPLIQSGVYLICAPLGFKPDFIPPHEARATGNVCSPWPRDCLARKWVDGVEILYVGKATQLRRRLRQLLRHSQGLVVNHTGGEIIWQLQGYEGLLICWQPDTDPRELEKSLIRAFKQANQGKLPFANRRN